MISHNHLHPKMDSLTLLLWPNGQTIIEVAKDILQKKFNIEHTTLQICSCNSNLSNCNHCN